MNFTISELDQKKGFLSDLLGFFQENMQEIREPGYTANRLKRCHEDSSILYKDYEIPSESEMSFKHIDAWIAFMNEPAHAHLFKQAKIKHFEDKLKKCKEYFQEKNDEYSLVNQYAHIPSINSNYEGRSAWPCRFALKIRGQHPLSQYRDLEVGKFLHVQDKRFGPSSIMIEGDAEERVLWDEFINDPAYKRYFLTEDELFRQHLDYLRVFIKDTGQFPAVPLMRDSTFLQKWLPRN
jgi:hypothetical protein